MTRKIKNFKCHVCGQNLYVKRCVSGNWMRYMPPRFCPYCGARVPTDEERTPGGREETCDEGTA